MSCFRCGSDGLDARGRCVGCGARPATPCPGCGHGVFEGANFCSACGHPLAERPAASSRQTAGRPTRPPSAGPRTAGSRAAFEGERKRVTVLFADIRGSLALIQGGDAEDVQALLDVVVAAMTEAVHRYEGVVNQVLGDGIMALFGVPVAHEDHVVRAAHAALAMQSAVRALREPGWLQRGLQPQIRVGLHAGDVAVRAVEGDLSTEYRAVGATTHIAARMEQLAPAGRVWTTAQTVALGGGLLRVRPMGPVEVKGVPEPVEVVELTGISTRTRFQANAVRGLSPLVDRVETMNELRSALDAAAAGTSKVAVLTGEPGVGKSRLCHELLSHAAQRFSVLEASAVSYGRSTPLGLLSSTLRSLIGIEDDDDGAEARDKTAAFLAALNASDDLRLPPLLELLDVPVEDREWRRLDPVQKRRQIEGAVYQLLARWCAGGPRVLLFEDLHWCDPDSLAFIARLVQSPPQGHTLVLLTFRPELQPDWTRLPHVLRCTVGPLQLSDSELLLRSLLSRRETPQQFMRGLLERTDGNPFFIEESARSLAEKSEVREPLSSYRPALPAADVPASVEALLDSRLDRLPEEALDVLQAAAVIGEDCPADLLREVAGLSDDELTARVEPLLRAQLLLEASRDVRGSGAQGVDATYRFKHALIQEVAYRRLVRARRQLLHERVLDAMEAQAGTRLAEHVERLAEHAYQAHAWPRCAVYQARACVRAAGRSANAQAIAHLERGLEVVACMPEGPARSRAQVDIRLTALAPLLTLGRHERLIELLREAEHHARALGDNERLAKVLSQLSAELWLTAQYDAAQQAVEQSLQLAGQLPSAQHALEISAHYNRAMIAHARGRFEEAAETLRGLLQLFEGEVARRRLGWAGYPAVLLRTFIIATSVMTGAFAEAARAFDQGRALADELGHPFSRTMILEQYGLCLLVQGEVQRAIVTLREALSVCLHEEVHTMHMPIVSHLGLALVEQGDLAEGRELLETTARGDLEAAGHYAIDYLFTGLAEARLRAGDLPLALAAAERAAQDTARCGEPAMHVRAQLQRGAVLTAMGRLPAAADALELAEREAARLCMHPWVALAQQARARLLSHQGQAGEARAVLARALAGWRELDAPARVAQVERELGALSA